MTHSTFNPSTLLTAPGDRIRHAVSALTERVAAAHHRRIRYHQCIRELSACSDRDLNDLGIARSDIKRIAREARDSVPARSGE